MPSLGFGSYEVADRTRRRHPGVNRGKGRGITKPHAGAKRRRRRR
jgi:hypothetical protein